MPTLLVEDGFRFFFYSAEPKYKHPHIHVEKGGGGAVFWLEPSVFLQKNLGMKAQDVAKARKIVLKYRKEFLERYYAVIAPKHK